MSSIFDGRLSSIFPGHGTDNALPSQSVDKKLMPRLFRTLFNSFGRGI